MGRIWQLEGAGPSLRFGTPGGEVFADYIARYHWRGDPPDKKDLAELPYNFAEPPYPEIRWDLAEIVDHARFPMAIADACDGILFQG